MESESPLTLSNFTCTKSVRCSRTRIYITQETGGLSSKFPSFKIAWRRQSVISWWYAKWSKESSSSKVLSSEPIQICIYFFTSLMLFVWDASPCSRYIFCLQRKWWKYCLISWLFVQSILSAFSFQMTSNTFNCHH